MCVKRWEEPIKYSLVEIDEVEELRVDPLEFIVKEFVHLYQGVCIKATVKEIIGDGKFRNMLAQEGNDIVTYEQLTNALNEKQENDN